MLGQDETYLKSKMVFDLEKLKVGTPIKAVLNETNFERKEITGIVSEINYGEMAITFFEKNELKKQTIQAEEIWNQISGGWEIETKTW